MCLSEQLRNSDTNCTLRFIVLNLQKAIWTQLYGIEDTLIFNNRANHLLGLQTTSPIS
jgi:hypothetical protein